jgi:rhodanese-related sulfurtransferase
MSRRPPAEIIDPVSAILPFRLQPLTAADELHAGRLLLIDVREEGDFLFGHARGSLHVHRLELMDRFAAFEKLELRLCFICAVGEQSRTAAELVVGRASVPVSYVDGGLARWAEAELPIETHIRLPA